MSTPSLGRSLWNNVSGLLGAAFKAALRTAGLMLLLGSILASLSWYFLREWPWYAAGGAALVFVEALLITVFLGGKAAITAAIVTLLEQLRLGGTAVQWIFDVAIRTAGEKHVGTVEQLPLAKAEQALNDGVQSFIKADPEAQGLRAGLRRIIQRRIGNLVRTITLAEFRHEDQTRGSVDLLKVRDSLTLKANDHLLRKVRAGRRLWTLAVCGGFVLLVALQTWGLRWALG